MINRIMTSIVFTMITTLVMFGVITTITQHSAYAQIPGLTNSPPPSTSQDQSSQQQQQQSPTTINGFSIYENSQYGFRIQYPSDWQKNETEIPSSGLEDNDKNPTLAQWSAAYFNSPLRSKGFSAASVSIFPLSLAKYLDVNDMKVKNKTAYDYATDSVNYMNSNDSNKYITFQVLRSEPILVGINHYQGWRIDYMEGGFGPATYVIDIYAVMGDKAFKFSFDSPDPLLVPTYLPIFQKIINSFQQINGG